MNVNQTVDLRIARTKLAIRDTLVTLIKAKGFDAVTVSDIATHAHINRGTFYLHYRDKFDLLEQTETEILAELQHMFLSTTTLVTGSLPPAAQLQQLVVTLLEYVKDHAALMEAFLGLQGNYSFVTRIRTMMEHNLTLGVLSGLKAENLLVPRDYLLAYIFHAHLGVLQAWLVGGCQESPQEMARIFLGLSFEGPLRAAGLGLRDTNA